ncbi:protein-L-isoaspartate O-methyltransferase [Roseiarcaceae bacterium H3SJ34-1]|uniref:protein-L-isoaspartate O-methyltransferase family protein n=1 Tax=Terripilifer ovatus TaxID=3032367 RepID=UPI003AB92E36|nr:protein-L-isoaspartate O-methyltransferase [Roseiarcaceae bacterium H3SJ34-1]
MPVPATAVQTAAASSCAALRQTMVDCQLRTFDITDRAVLDAALDIPREIFLPGLPAAVVYSDRILQIGTASGHKRSMLAPMVVARLIQAAALTSTDRVLVVGAGTGYTAALIGRLAAQVYALDSDAELSRLAAENFARIGAANIEVVTGPLAAGLPQHAPFDLIVIDGAIEVHPDSLLTQLREGGRLTAVVHPAAAAGRRGKATLFEKNSGHIGNRVLFDAAGDLLEGFERKPEFSF